MLPPHHSTSYKHPVSHVRKLNPLDPAYPQ
jgi:hypothetical protein